jgi:TonB family protein
VKTSTQPGLIAAACILLAACGAAPKPKPVAAPPVPLLIASPQSESAPAALEARLTVAEDSQMLLRFKVEADGSVQDVTALMSRLPDETSSAVLAAFAGLRFRPFVQGGKPVARVFIYPLFFGPDAVSERTRFTCRHQQELYLPASRCDIVQSGVWQVYRVTPPYPEVLLSAPVTGAVTLSFDVGTSGVPSNVKVVKSVPAGVFDTAAVVALQQWYFELRDGATATPLQHASVTLNFTPPTSPGSAAHN